MAKKNTKSTEKNTPADKTNEAETSTTKTDPTATNETVDQGGEPKGELVNSEETTGNSEEAPQAGSNDTSDSATVDGETTSEVNGEDGNVKSDDTVKDDDVVSEGSKLPDAVAKFVSGAAKETSIDASPIFDEQVSAMQRYALETFRNYASDMAPNVSQTVASVNLNQTKLYRCIVKTINTCEIGELAVILQKLLRCLAENRKGAFNEMYLYRGQADVGMNTAARRTYEEIFNLLTFICDDENRNPAIVETIDFETLLIGSELTEESRERFIALIKRMCQIS